MLAFLLILPAFTFVSLAYGYWLQYSRSGLSAPVRMALLKATLAGSVLVVGITELTSHYRLVTMPGVATGWALAGLISGLWAGHLHRSAGIPTRPVWPKVVLAERWWLVITGLVLGLTLLTGLLYPPNNNDSMTYHMGRIGHWVQQHSVEPFATHIERQLYQPPLAEWIILHLYLLTGSDELANAVQWLLGIGCLLGLSVLVQQMGGNRRQQLATVFVAATVPMVVLQLSSTQNDVAVAFYLIALAVFLTRLYRTDAPADLICVGIALGGSWLTKGTAYLFAAPLLLTWGLLSLNRLRTHPRGWSLLRLAGTAFALVGLAVLLNSGYYIRNLAIYANPLANGPEQATYTNQLHSPAALVSNISRNVGIHFGIPGVQWLVQTGIEKLHNGLGLSINDPRTSYAGLPFRLPRLSINEDNASNFLHVLALAGGLVWLFRNRNQRAYRPLALLAAVVGLMAFLFCAYLKWQPWHSRLQTPLFLLAAPLMGYGLATLSPRAVRWATGLLAVSALWFAVANFTRPLITVPLLTAPTSWMSPRLANYYSNDPAALPIHTAIARFVNQRINTDTVRIGVILSDAEWDYTWYRQFSPLVRLYHIRVIGPSRWLMGQPPLDYVVTTMNGTDTLTNNGLLFRRINLTTGRAYLYSRVRQPVR